MPPSARVAAPYPGALLGLDDPATGHEFLRTHLAATSCGCSPRHRGDLSLVEGTTVMEPNRPGTVSPLLRRATIGGKPRTYDGLGNRGQAPNL
ncbi:hypothetical protein KSZ_68520 [Dictyobacter formicarum]|uniref:Uncharacterized protein n=1 Tax=Dictyobacter formicarum TaxID=2778368 RepID=A0ABQ3VUS5_9CHLR|nr:hypothetical protein KSZ_68520 [Dictyobacter formicarum]